jgi:death-on-curing protein
MGRTCEVLTLEDIVTINRKFIDAHGGVYFLGDDNLANPGSLLHVLEEIQGSFFGIEPFPSLFDKAAAICYRIIAGHVFHDGNKRTGMEATRLFMEINGYNFLIDFEVIDVALMIARGDSGIPQLATWIEARSIPILRL